WPAGSAHDSLRGVHRTKTHPSETRARGMRPVMFAKRHRQLWLAGTVLIVLAAVVGTLTYTGVFHRPASEPGPRGQGGGGPAPTPIAPRPNLPDPEQPGGPVARLLTLANPQPDEPARILVSLGRPRYHDSTPNGADESIMAHEIVRQAVLESA